jgi:hypothetical protein
MSYIKDGGKTRFNFSEKKNEMPFLAANVSNVLEHLGYV